MGQQDNGIEGQRDNRTTEHLDNQQQLEKPDTGKTEQRTKGQLDSMTTGRQGKWIKLRFVILVKYLMKSTTINYSYHGQKIKYIEPIKLIVQSS